MNPALELSTTPAAAQATDAESPPVTVVMVTYSSSGVIGESLQPLRAAHQEGLIRCVVVDNASPDGTADRIAREHPWVDLVRSPGNIGYGRGCNLGFERVRTPHVLFMNPDVVLGPGSIRVLQEFLQSQERAGMVAPATSVGRFGYQPSGGSLTPWSLMGMATGLPVLQPRQRVAMPGEAPFKTDWLCGAVLMARSQAIRDVGGFDPRFFLYFEETDLCRRLRAAGWELWAAGTAQASHHLGLSARKVDPLLAAGDCLSDHFYRSRYYYLSKHYGFLAAAASESAELVVKASRDFLRVLLQRPSRHELRSRLNAPMFQWPERHRVM
jgi:N-acetylglucosaminyl-diphospho-decaprenol L-rhamnosyltransferase